MGLSTIETGRGSHPGFVIIPRQGTRRGRWDPGLRALDRGNGPAARTGQGTDGAGAGGGGRWVRGWLRLCDKGEGQMFVTRCSREWGGGLGKTYRAVSCILPSRSLGRAWEARDRDPGFTADVILCLNLGPPHPRVHRTHTLHRCSTLMQGGTGVCGCNHTILATAGLETSY